MWIESLIIVSGGALIILLASLVIKKSISLATHFGLSDTLVGMTVLSIGTSLPEIITHIAGSFQIISDSSVMDEVSSMVVGTNIGSDIFQQNLILGIVAFFGVLTVSRKKNLPVIGGLIGAALILWIMSFNHHISRLEGLILIIGYIVYLIYLQKKGIKADEVEPERGMSKKDVTIAILLLLISFVAMAYTANKVLQAARIVVEQLPISASFFGVLVLGVVAAFPELFTAIVAASRKHGKMSAGVLLGSNITNPAFALGLGALISTYNVPSVVVFFDLPVKIATALLIFLFFWKDEKIRKSEAAVLIALFVIYLIVRQIYFPTDII